MPSIVSLDDYLKKTTDKFEKKKKFLIFSETVYRPTSEKVTEGYRYFDCDVNDLIKYVEQGDIKAISELEFAIDDEGDADTSSVRLDIAYTDSSSMIAIQVVEYQNYNPTPVTDVVLLEGDAIKALKTVVRDIDQTA